MEERLRGAVAAYQAAFSVHVPTSSVLKAEGVLVAAVAAGGEHSVCTFETCMLACFFSCPHAPGVRKPGTCYVLGVFS